MHQHGPEVHVLRKVTDCPDGKVCPAVLTVSTQPGWKAVVGRVVTDPTEAAALGHHIGPGEAVVLVPDQLLPEV